MRVELVYEISGKHGCRFGVDSEGGMIASDGSKSSLRDYLGGDPNPVLVIDALRTLHRYARNRLNRLTASPMEKNMVIGVLMLAFWQEGMREMRFVEDKAGNIVLLLKQDTKLTPPTPIEFPPLDRIDVWNNFFATRADR